MLRDRKRCEEILVRDEIAVSCDELLEVERRVGWPNLARHLKGSKKTQGDFC